MPRICDYRVLAGRSIAGWVIGLEMGSDAANAILCEWRWQRKNPPGDGGSGSGRWVACYLVAYGLADDTAPTTALLVGIGWRSVCGLGSGLLPYGPYVIYGGDVPGEPFGIAVGSEVLFGSHQNISNL